jgi:hypothetical protein
MNATTIIDTAALFASVASSALNFAEGEAIQKSLKESLVEAMVELRKAGVRFCITGRDGKGKTDACPNRKALKAAIMADGRAKDGRAKQLVGMLALYHEANVPVGTLDDYDAVYRTIGKKACQDLGIPPKDTAPNGSTVRDAAEQAGKVSQSTGKVKASRMPKLTPIWGHWEAIQEHEDFHHLQAWLALPAGKKKPSLEEYVKQQHGSASLKAELEATKRRLAELEAMASA